jgi:hypothetical protein
MIKGGSYAGARLTQPASHRSDTREKINVGQGNVRRVRRTRILTFIVLVVLQCIACNHGCRCMSDGVFIQFACQVLKSLESKLRSARDLSVLSIMVTMGGDLQPGCLADRLLTGVGQPQINP